MILESAEKGNAQTTFIYLACFGFSTIGGNWISSLSYFLGDSVLIPFAREIREAVFRKIMDLDFAFHVERSTGSMISAFRRGDGAVFDLFQNLHSELFPVLVNLVVAMYFLSLASAELAVILFVMFIFNLGLVTWLVKINLKSRTDFNTAEDNVSGVITDSIINYETVKFFAGENKESRNLGTKFDIWTKKLWGFSNSFRLMDVTIGTTSGGGMLLILWLSVNKLGHGFSLGDLVMVTGFLTAFHYQFFNLFFRLRNIAKNMVDLEKYLSILDSEVSVKDPVKPKYPAKVDGRIVFDHVTFSYPRDTTKTIDDINITIEPGTRVAFVGRSGAGKTTLIKLLLRFYDPTAGKITLDGIDIREMTKSSLRLVLGVVPQEPIMFNNTLKFNLSYGKENASIEEIEEAARKANILDFIQSLTDKWETQVGERGIKLSGGQKQRLAIARALLSNPKVLVFDEATSNLDSESELKIQSALDEAAKERTVIIIAHRFSTIRNADKILVLSGGTVVENGNHKSLIAKNGIYKKLWSLQAKGKSNTS
jgi:ATP-binding cassette subfamily B protein